MAALVFVALHDLVGPDLGQVGVGHLFVFDRAEVLPAELTETELLFARRGKDGDGDVNETEADTALPDSAHNGEKVSTLQAGGERISFAGLTNCESWRERARQKRAARARVRGMNHLIGT